MQQLSAYVPQDRLRALALGTRMPNRTSGAALFADISGFTPLTEALTQQDGPRRGIEELTRQINAVYDSLIAEIERYGGSVISFAGDAITCWFDLAPAEIAAASAVSAALAMQKAMSGFPQLGLKVAVTSGPARRFVVGDPAVQYMDALAGATVARLAASEHLTGCGETLVDTATVEALGSTLDIGEWRTAEAGKRFAVVQQFHGQGQAAVVAAAPEVSAETLRPWVLPMIFAREQGEHRLFLTELRPAVALFLRFTGIDYDADEQAGEKLDALICQAQAALERFEGALLQLTIGDKGSYLYAAFGAPLVHEDDARRAVQAALALRTACARLDFLAPVQIGLSQGVMRSGAYGGTTRRTYGVLGDDVNLAARLMSSAAPGEILLPRRVQKEVRDLFSFEPRPPLLLKGKSEPLPVFAVTGQRRQRAIRLEEPRYALPMMGRQAELAVIDDKLNLARQRQGQVIGIMAEAGMGKSRLVAETIRLALTKGFTGYGGACEASGTNTPYLVWKPIWQAFLGLDPEAPLRRQLRNLEGEIEERAPQRVEAIPVLSVLLDIPIEETDFTRTLEPKDRRNVLTALLEDCLKSAAAEGPLLLVLEDAHWLDALSHELLETLVRVSAALPVCFVLAYRPPHNLQAVHVDGLAENQEHFTRITLSQLTTHETEGLIRAKLGQLFPERMGALPQALVSELNARAEGNPFYIEELLNYLHDRDISPYDGDALKLLDLPSSLHALILSRMDRLSESQQIILKSASIIGRTFRVNWLHGYYPALGAAEQVKADLEELSQLDLTPLDSLEPELAYLFKHIITREVAYESLPYATRARLHAQLAQYVEATVSAVSGLGSESMGTERYLDLLAFHYGLSGNTDKKREYFRKAGEAAQETFANQAALAYYDHLLPLLTTLGDQMSIHARRGAVYELLGQYAEAEAAQRAVLELAEAAGDRAAAADAQLALGKICRLRGEYAAALDWLRQAQAGWAALEKPAGLGQALSELGAVYWRQGEYARAARYLEEALIWAQQACDRHIQALVLKEAGNVAYLSSDYAKARARYEQSMALYLETGDRWGVGVALGNLGNVAYEQGDYAAARTLHEQSLALARQIGDRVGVAGTLDNLGNVAYEQGDYAAARTLYEQSLAPRREIGDQQGTANSLNNLGLVAYVQGDYAAARALHEQSLALARQIGDKAIIAYALLGLGLDDLAQIRTDSPAAVQAARQFMLESLAIRQEMGQQFRVISSLVGLAGAAMRLGEAHRAARLLGAVASALAVLQAALEAEVRSLHEQTQAAAQAALGEASFRTAWAEGAAQTLDQAAADELAGQGSS